MSLSIASILDAAVSHALASGLFERVNTHEPKSAPGNGLTAAVWAQEVAPVAEHSGLAATSARVEFSIRIYSNMLAEPQDMIDPNVIAAVDKLVDAYSGDFQLGGTVSYVDLLGAHGTPLRAQAGYLEQDHKMFRVMTITLPLIVSDVWTQSP